MNQSLNFESSETPSENNEEFHSPFTKSQHNLANQIEKI